MKAKQLVSLCVAAWGLAACCSENWSYDSAAHTLRPVQEDVTLQVSRVSIDLYPTGPWGYAIPINVFGPYKAETKALAVGTIRDSANNEIDAFILWGDGRGDARAPFVFQAPITVKEIIAAQKGLRWPDHVFAPGYSLRPLSELEAYVRAHRHLPGLPSATQISQQGLPLVQTQAQLVEKVEELTLYLIQLQKEVDSLKALLARRP